MSRAPDKRPQDKHLQRSEQKVRSLLFLFCHSRRSTLTETAMVDRRLSVVKGR
jgi:hypothetical protein